MATMVDMASPPQDPDAQGTVTDFLDYTEYLPSDLIRSLTLIRGLDDSFLSNSYAVHDLTKKYGALPSLPVNSRPHPQTLRTQISTHLDRALSAREASYAEACRLYDVADRHHNRLSSIINKLHALPKPPSRDPTPEPVQSPEVKRSRSGRKIEDGTSIQRLTLNPPRANGVAVALPQKSRKRRVTVPGDVLPPYNPDSPIASTEQSDWESDAPSPIRPNLKLKQTQAPKPKKEKAPRLPRVPRDSTGPYKMPTPPPEDAKIGDKYRPWTRLTEWEMWKLRKKMKKNITWEPSDVMIQRELTARGRGWGNYYRAKGEAQANGTEFMDVDNLDQGRTKDEGERLGEPVTGTIEVTNVRNRGMKLNEAKKLKRDIIAREQAAQAAQEAELAARRLGDIGSAFKNLFSPLSSALANLQRNTSSPTANGSKNTGKKDTIKSPKKRKLEEFTASASPSVEADPKKKKPKLAPKPSPFSTSTPTDTVTKKIPIKLNLPTRSAERSSVSSPASPNRPSSARRASVAPKAESTPPVVSRPSSRHSVSASVEAAIVPVRASRRPSTPAVAPRRTPAVEASPKTASTAAGRRSKREAPGTITQSSQDGGAAVSVSRRKTKPNKQAKAAQVEKVVEAAPPQIRVDVDGKQEIVDPDEERYCLCGDISYGEMICCELDEKCESGQWFHMECVHLIELPPRTVKWYCPGCRKKYKKGDNSNGLVGRGIK